MMTDNHRLDSNRQAPARKRWLATVVLIGLLACQGLVGFATGIPDPSDQDLGLLRFVAKGPIQIEVVDPDGLLVNRVENTIEGATFTDENDEVTIEIASRKVGVYQVQVNLDGSSSRLQRFDVSASDGTKTIMLADRELIANAPQEPYRIQSDAAGFDIAPEVEEEPSGLSTTLIIIIVAAAAVLVVGGIVFLRSRKKK